MVPQAMSSGFTALPWAVALLAEGIPCHRSQPGFPRCVSRSRACPGSERADGAGDEGRALLFVLVRKSAAFELSFQ